MLLGVFEEFDDFKQLVLGFVNAGYVIESHPGIGFDVNLGSTFTDRHEPATAHPPCQKHP
jgi:hypothetical protein